VKLDTDLIREILIWCEDKLPDKGRSYQASEIVINDYTSDEILYHVALLVDGGYLKVIDASAGGYEDYIIERLTNGGAQFLEIIKSDTGWKKFKAKAKEIGIPAIPVMLPIIVDLIRKAFGLP